jgi:hypothetical protein
MSPSPRVIFVIPIVMIAAVCTLHAREMSYRDHLFSLVIPDEGWSADTTRTYQSRLLDRVLLATDADNTTMVEVYLYYDQDDELAIDDDYADALFDELRSRGAVLHGSGYMTLGGVKALYYGARIVPDSGQPYDRFSVQAVANGVLYRIDASSVVGHPEDDADVREMIAGFTFIDIPHLPDHGTRAHRVYSSPSQGAIEGRALGALAFMIVAIVGGIFLWRARERRRQRIYEEQMWKG